MTDRRGRPRFEVVGRLPGTLEMWEAMPLRNVGREGALLESRVPLARDSVHVLTLKSRGRAGEIRARVRHVTAMPGPAGEPRFLIGLEFLALPAPTLEAIDALLKASGGYPGPAEV